MEKGFFLYGVHMGGTGPGVDEGAESAVPVDPDSADPLLSYTQSAMASAKPAMDFFAIQFVVKRSFPHKRHCLLPN
jgi:hypothetical protein